MNFITLLVFICVQARPLRECGCARQQLVLALWGEHVQLLGHTRKCRWAPQVPRARRAHQTHGAHAQCEHRMWRARRLF